MSTFGGYSSFPRTFGGAKPRARVVHEALAVGNGTAYDSLNPDTLVYLEDLATAHAISDAFGTNERVGNMWDPWACSVEDLERWERILKFPKSGLSVYERRQRFADHLAKFGESPFRGYLHGELERIIGPVFVAIESISVENAVITVPDGTYPWGTPNADAPWSSTVAHMLVRTQKPAGYTEAQYLTAIAEANRFLDDVLPAWSTFTCYRPGAISHDVPGGPSAAGFYLDEPFNLDFQVFRQ